jgi:hypothetical protein
MTLPKIYVRPESFETINLNGWGAKVVQWTYVLTVATLAFWTIDDVREPWPTFVAVAVYVAASLALTLDKGERLSLPVSIFVIASGVVNSVLVSWQLVNLGYSQWFVGAASVALLYMSLRGRIALAWLGFALLCVPIVIWGLTVEDRFLDAVLVLARQVPTLIVGTLFATALRRSGDEIRRLTTEGMLRARAEAATIGTAREREERVLALGEFATPMLEKLANGGPITAAERLEYALAEAELRDGLRAPSLVLPDVSAAARSARRRGVEVVLLDDSDPSVLGPGDLARAASRIAALINASKGGRVTARLLPPGRGTIATIVVDGAEHVSEDVLT